MLSEGRHEPATNHLALEKAIIVVQASSLHLPRAQFCKKKVILNIPYIILQISGRKNLHSLIIRAAGHGGLGGLSYPYSALQGTDVPILRLRIEPYRNLSYLQGEASLKFARRSLGVGRSSLVPAQLQPQHNNLHVTSFKFGTCSSGDQCECVSIFSSTVPPPFLLSIANFLFDFRFGGDAFILRATCCKYSDRSCDFTAAFTLSSVVLY